MGERTSKKTLRELFDGGGVEKMFPWERGEPNGRQMEQVASLERLKRTINRLFFSILRGIT